MNTHPTPTRRTVRGRVWRLAALGAVGAAVLAACGDDDDNGASDTTGAPETPGAPTTAGAPATSAAPATTVAPDTTGAPMTTVAAPATTAASDTTGPTSGGAATVATAEADVGTILVDANGMTLYAFTPDEESGQPTCTADCAEAWPPALVEGEPNYGDLDASVFSLVDTPAGPQLKAGNWPLYTFAGDSVPGDVNGQGQGGVWYVVAPDGSLIQ